MQAVFETLFDIVYLTAVITLGIGMIRGSGGRKQYLLYGIMAVTQGCGDAFHLAPRAIALCTTGLEDYTAALGIGKLITSLTMTAFYVLLYYVWRSRYRISGYPGITAAESGCAPPDWRRTASSPCSIQDWAVRWRWPAFCSG